MPERGEQGRGIAGINRAGCVGASKPQLLRSLFAIADPEKQIAEVEADDGGVWKTLREGPELREGAHGMVLREAADGGGSERLGIAQGIHWHMNVANEVEYITTDGKRQVIPWVRVKDRFGNVREYTAEGTKPEDLTKGERRRMDCMDCHNRPAHAIAATPERAVNELMARGDIPQSLPFAHREAVKALKASYPTDDAAEQGISRSLRDFYRSQSNDVYMTRRQDVEKAVQAALAIYRRNVFPDMKVQFGTYPNNIGHMDFPGCFRCHDDNHKTSDGKKIGQDCDTCHEIK